MAGRLFERRAVWFVVADACALLVFVLLGLRGHQVDTIAGFVRNAVPLFLAWALVAWLLRTYRRPGWRSLLRTWIVAVPIGLLARTMLVGSPRGARILVFLGVGLAFTLLFLVLARLLVRSIARGR
jgi:Protein of unknown function (DUF3054)